MKTPLNSSGLALLGRLCVAPILVSLFGPGTLCSAAALKHIAVNATALREYVRPTDAAGKPLPESYVFTPGKFFGGRTSDPRMSNTKFEEIVRWLAPNLAKQNYFPTREVSSANLLIMVHWGTTEIYEDPQEPIATDRLNTALSEFNSALEANGGIADPGAVNAALGDRASADWSAQGAIARNSALLGYKPTLTKEQQKVWASTTEQTMNAELNEERYFVILMAYDYQLMRKEKKTKPLWITRISVRSPGTNFTEAMPAIAYAGASAFGRHIDGLVRVNVDSREARVELGELKSLGAVEEESSANEAEETK
jgi:hypothetical protein